MCPVHNNVAGQTVSSVYFFSSSFVHCSCPNFMFLSLFLSFSLVTARAFPESMRQCEQRCTVHPSFLRNDYASMIVTHPNPVQSSLTATQLRGRLGHLRTDQMVQTMRPSKNLKDRSRVDTWEYRDRFKSVYKIVTLSLLVSTYLSFWLREMTLVFWKLDMFSVRHINITVLLNEPRFMEEPGHVANWQKCLDSDC